MPARDRRPVEPARVCASTIAIWSTAHQIDDSTGHLGRVAFGNNAPLIAIFWITFAFLIALKILRANREHSTDTTTG